MPESLLSPSQVKLFGRPFDALAPVPPSAQDADPNPVDGHTAVQGPDPSLDRLANQLARGGVRLARIYGFAYEGRYYALPRPSLFLVHGDGRAIAPGSHGPLDQSGVAVRDFLFEDDVVYWEYDRVAYSLRCDVVSGTLDEILIDACLRSGDGDASSADMAPGADAATSRSHLAARSHLSARSHLTSRADLEARHKIR